MEKKVSIITPCLNGEKFVARYLESILNQTYKNIELIFINDGSTDKTEEIVKSYISKFKQSGMILIYRYQQNAGQAAALNLGLKLFSGDYLTWSDSDDFLAKDSIEKKVEFLEKNKEYGLVRTDMYIFNEFNLNSATGLISCKNPNRFDEHIFEDIIKEKTYCSNGCYMIRTDAFLNVNPKREIYVSLGGQNWQMLLPITYKYKCGYIDEPLYNYVIRSDSHSHCDEDISLEVYLKKYSNHEDILRNVINSMELDKDYYNNLISEKYARRKLDLAAEYRNKELLLRQYGNLKKMGVLNFYDNITYLCGLFYGFNLGYKVIHKLIYFTKRLLARLV